VTLGEIGKFTENCRGFWYGQARLDANVGDVGILLKTGGDPPGEREAAFWRQIVGRWPALWQDALDALRRDLYFDSSEQAAAFFAAIRPTGFVFHQWSPGEEQWEIDVEPDYSDHLLQVFMRGMTYDHFGQDG
jgi:hypothetical protein